MVGLLQGGVNGGLLSEKQFDYVIKFTGNCPKSSDLFPLTPQGCICKKQDLKKKKSSGPTLDGMET